MHCESRWDILIHEYFGVTLERIWNVIKNEAPDLRLSIDRIIQDENPDG